MSVNMTVDPGLGGTGWALWTSDEHWRLLEHPVATGVIEEKRGNWLPRSGWYAQSFSKLLLRYKPLSIWIEYPELHTTAAGIASASKGDIFKLMFLVGRYAECCAQVRGEGSFVPLPVAEWKGTMSKEAVIRRIARRLNISEETYPNHTADAVGMGLHVKGVWNGTGEVRQSRTYES